MGAFPDGFVIRSDWPRSVDHIFDTYEVNRHDWEFESLDTQADYIRPTDVVARQSEGDDTKFELIQLTSVGITKPLIQLASIKESTALRPRTITGPTCLTATKFRIKNQVYLESILYPGPTSLFQCFRAPFVCNNENLLFHLQPQDPNAALRLVRLYDGIEMFRKVHRRDTRIIAAHMTRLNLFLLEIFPPKPPRCPVSRTLCSVYELRFLKKLYHFRCPDGTLGLTSTNDGRVVLDVANAAKGSVSKWVLDPVAGGCVDLRDRGVGYYCLVREFEARDGIRTGRPGVDRVFFRDVKCKSSDVDVQMVK
ncbi:hypothetical protein HK097_009999 [Rhizophlyctis rosea]|uniref:Uncharacterized protein n=1 Tax=Rhizophlyctis rosea TaxID=64517 RepID=A0AAD5X442_9FUNG|nr:hypothetical protein HK097_009999 [Rhizophlyctis rosea]